MKVVICAIAKFENAYLTEWITYHFKLGFSHIYLYDNNDIEGERIEQAVPDEFKEKVTVIDVRGKRCMQLKVYDECYYKYDFDWCAFIDIDEFISFPEDSQYHTIQDFLRDKQAFEAVHINWKCYGDNGLVHYSDASVLARFSNPWPVGVYYEYSYVKENEHIKSIIRKGLNINWIWNAHTPSGLTEVCNSEGIPVDGNSPFAPISHSKAFVRHYLTKTVEEYCIKVKRQGADNDIVNYSFPKFFRINRPSLRKLVWLKRNFPNVRITECLLAHMKFCIVNNAPLMFLCRKLGLTRKM